MKAEKFLSRSLSDAIFAREALAELRKNDPQVSEFFGELWEAEMVFDVASRRLGEILLRLGTRKGGSVDVRA